jgi:sulfatase modifying factor 1
MHKQLCEGGEALRGKYRLFFPGIAFALMLSFLYSCGTASGVEPVEPTAYPSPILVTTNPTIPSIAGISWDSSNHAIIIRIKHWPASWSAWNMFVSGVKIPTGEGPGDIIVRPNAPLNQPPDGLIVGTLPWVTGLDKVDFPCCGSLQFSIPGIGLTNTYAYNLHDGGCVTASKQTCESDSIGDKTVKQDKPSHENMVLISAGTFWMGRQNRKGWSPMAAPEMFNDELPAHEVYVDAFYIDKYEVTNAQFKEFVDATRYITDAEKQGASDVMVPIKQAETPLKGSDIGWKWTSGASWRRPEGPGSSIDNRMNHPVVHITWNDANAFAKWVGKRLPTEAEWEKAARGGTKTNWYWGDNLDDSGKYANMYAEHRLDFQYPQGVFDGFSTTAPVGSFKPNHYGLYDMAGNVFEWTTDWYQYDYFKISPRDNPKGPASGIMRVIKGGAWYFCECYLRPAERQPSEIGTHNHGLGFRLALDVNK